MFHRILIANRGEIALRVIRAARELGVETDAVHPGYGFLSENAEFAEMVRHAGLGWIGPRPEMIRMMGNKIRAKEAMKEAGLPQLPGSEGVVQDERDLARLEEHSGFSVILKAAAGGGGRGMKIVREKDQLAQMYRPASAGSPTAFGNGGMYLDRY